MFKPVLLALAIIGAFPGGALAQSPTIVVDEAHSYSITMKHPVTYAIPAASSLIVDPGSYTFPYRSNFKGAGPNAIYLFAGNRSYKAVWHEPPDRIILDATTLQPTRPDSEPFRGFASGDRWMVSIGIDRPERAKTSAGAYRNWLDALWMGLVLVK